VTAHDDFSQVQNAQGLPKDGCSGQNHVSPFAGKAGNTAPLLHGRALIKQDLSINLLAREKGAVDL